nr:MAG TPA: hypothetical protein [Caudoviricetes sp.]
MPYFARNMIEINTFSVNLECSRYVYDSSIFASYCSLKDVYGFIRMYSI